MSFASGMRPRTGRSYTLVELLVVLCIFITVTGIALPAFTRLAKGGGVTSAARTICSMINGSRSYALSHRCYVALVFPTAPGIDAGAPDSLRYLYARPAIVMPVTGATSSPYYAFSKWVDGESWRKMPSGIFFGGPVYDINLAANGMASFGNPLAVKSCDFSDINGSASSADISNCLVFTPAGAIAGSSANPLPFLMGIWEGGIENGFTPKPTNRSNMLKVVVNQFTGRASCLGR